MSSSGLLHAMADPAARAIASVVDRLPVGPPRAIVLTYHRVAPRRPDDPLLPGMISATPEAFERHLDLLASRAPIVSIDDLLSALDQGRLRRHVVLLTFDDAYRDVADHAWPILRRRGLPAVLFVPTGFIGRPERPFWWDRLHHALRTSPHAELRVGGRPVSLADEAARASAWRALRAEIKALPHDEGMALVDAICADLGVEMPPSGVVDWADLRRLADEGLAIAPHTVNHPLLTRVTTDRARDEVAESARELRERIGTVAPVFAYPSGAHDEHVAEAVRREGVRAAFTTMRGSVRPGRDDPMRLRRVNVGPGTTDALLTAEMALLARIGRVPRT